MVTIGKSAFSNRNYDNANEAWEDIYWKLNTLDRNDGVYESAPRGLRIKEALDCDIKIMHPNKCLVYNTYRGLSPIYISKEFYWYLSGDNSAEVAGNLSKFWLTIANDDGTVNSNYGYYIFRKGSGKDPNKSVWEETIELFKKDIDTRHAIMQIPIMPARGSKDTPCTSSIHFIVRENKLYCTVLMRSTDIIKGAPIDWFQFCSWQCMMAKALGVELGWFRFISDSIHCYENDFLINKEEFSNSIRESLKVEKSELSEYDRLSGSFVSSMNALSMKSLDDVTEPILKYMLEHKKIWK